jgi:hypothetical protein
MNTDAVVVVGGITVAGLDLNPHNNLSLLDDILQHLCVLLMHYREYQLVFHYISDKTSMMDGKIVSMFCASVYTRCRWYGATSDT